MKKKYGGIDGGQAIEDVQEAVVVGIKKPVKKLSKGSVIFGLLAYVLVTSLMVSLIIVATGLSELMIANKVPTAIYFAIIFLPTILLGLRILYNSLKGR